MSSRPVARVQVPCTKAVGLRPATTVMRLARMGAAHQTRLSFMRSVLRRIKREAWTFARTGWDVDERGVGTAVYEMRAPGRTYSLVCFANDLPPEKRSDRVIATEWDATFALYDGVPGPADIERMSRNVPKQEAGRCSADELVLSRANRSVRLFNHVVEALAGGRQPHSQELDEVGYLMRTTAVYGNGKFGLADRAVYETRPEAGGPFHLELLAVWLIRMFSVDIAEHLARVRGGEQAVRLDPDLRRRLGVGNATGLGMAPFVINHPTLINAWMTARETALARARALPAADERTRGSFIAMARRAAAGLTRWRTADPRQSQRIRVLASDLACLLAEVEAGALEVRMPWDGLYRWAEQNLSLEGQEAVVSLIVEPHGDLVDELADTMSVDEDAWFSIDGRMTLSALRALVEDRFAWALEVDFADSRELARFWYVSEEKLEPRLGERFEEPGAERELRLGVAHDVKALLDAARTLEQDQSVGEFLLARPEHRHTVRRVQLAGRLPYSEICDNVLSARMLPIDILRCKLAFFGATRFDPKSDRWVRITMYADAPFPDELADMDADDWAWPPPAP